MGARAYKGGGGFLNNVDATLIGYTFQTTFEGKHDPASRTLFTRFAFKEDGKDTVSEITLKTGVLRKDFEGEIQISEDGKVVTPDDIIWFKSQPGGRVFYTLQFPLDGGAGFPQDRLAEDVVDFRPVLGTRVRVVQVIDKENQLYFGRQALGKAKAEKATEAEILEAGKREDKETGKRYNRTVPEIQTVYTVPQSTQQSKTTTQTKTTGNGVGQDLVGLAEVILKEILAENGGSIANEDIGPRITPKMLKRKLDQSTRDGIKALLLSAEFQAREKGWKKEDGFLTVAS